MIKALTLEIKSSMKTGKTILLVEDEHVSASVQERTLSNLGYEVILAYSGEQAMELFHGARPIDLVLMDIELGSGMNGFDAARAIMKDNTVPVVFLTAHAGKDAIAKIKDITNYGFVEKNMSSLFLDQTIRWALELFETRAAFERNSNALVESKEHYRAAFETNKDAISVNKMDGTYVDVNDGYMRLLGYTKEDVIGKTSLEAGVWADPLDREKMVAGLVKDGGIDDEEFMFRCKDGSCKTGVMSARVITLKNEPHLLTTTRDITESKKAETVLRNSEELYRALFELAVVGIVTGSHEGIIKSVNPKFCEMVGLNAELLVGRPIHMVPFTRDSIERHPLRFDLLQKGEVVITERTIVRSDGSELTIEMHTKMMPDGTYYSIYHDVTERKRAEEALRESERSFASLFYDSPSLMVVSDMDNGVFVDVNNRFLNAVGYTKEQVIGKSSLDLGIWADPQDRVKIVTAVKEHGHFRDFETRLITSAGEVREFLCCFDIIMSNGKPCLLSSMTDLTEYNKMKEQVQNMQKLESIGVLAGGIAHDLNNLLQGLFSYLQLIERKVRSTGPLMPYITSALDVFKKASNLTQQFLTFSKGAPLKKEIVLLQDIISPAIKFNLSGSLNITAVFDPPERLWPVNVDVAKLNQAISNLIINAKQAMNSRGGGVLTVTAENIMKDEIFLPMLPPGPYVMLSIQDNGPGIPAEYVSKIFDPYFTTKSSGSGLGLATSYSIVKNHGGHLYVDATSVQGAVFKIMLPAMPGAVIERQQESSPYQRIYTGKVLLMDDDPAVLHTTQLYLQDRGFEVVTAVEGKEAISLYAQALAHGERFRFIFLDLTVREGMGGKEALSIILGMDPNVKALVASGYSADQVLNFPERYGFRKGIIKPYLFTELDKVLQEIISDDDESEQ